MLDILITEVLKIVYVSKSVKFIFIEISKLYFLYSGSLRIYLNNIFQINLVIITVVNEYFQTLILIYIFNLKNKK